MRWILLSILLLTSCATYDKDGYEINKWNEALVEKANTIIDKSLWHKILVVRCLEFGFKREYRWCVFKDADGRVHVYTETGSTQLIANPDNPSYMAQNLKPYARIVFAWYE